MSSIATYTPGPWTVIGPDHETDHINIGTADVYVAAAIGGFVDGGKMQEANARLIAAAPDLLDEITVSRNAFAEFAEFILNRPDKSSGLTSDECAAMFSEMQTRRLACDAVIAKATGGQ